MPGLPQTTRKWLELSDIDYIGPFVKAWLAYNAWYRNQFGVERDRDILEKLKWQPNVIRNKTIPLLKNDGEDADRFRGHIGELHQRLENYEIKTEHSGEWERITFNNVFLRKRTPTQNSRDRYHYNLSVTPGQNNQITVEVRAKVSRNLKFQLVQTGYDADELQADAKFAALTTDQRATLIDLYQGCNPREVVSLVSNGGSEIDLGAYKFHCEHEQLFAGLCEVIYSMRCCLFHGELEPDPDAFACYEPAYRVIRRFLDCIG